MFEDVLYPDAGFLFELNGVGGPMAPYRFYAVLEADIDAVADFYLGRLPEFEVELDVIEEGSRHLMLARTGSVLDQLGQVEDPTQLVERGRELDGTLMGLEVIHSADDVSISRLRVARHAYQRGDEIPQDAVVIILEYFQNVYG